MKKKIFAALVVTMLFVNGINAQQSANPTTADGFVSGQIVLPGGSPLVGSIKESIRKKGEVVLLVDGKKTKYKAGDVASVRIGNTSYITNNYTFYEIVHGGNNVSLLRKASEPSTQYNGTDAIVVTSEGDIDDLFVKKGETAMKLVTKKNYKEVLGDCAGTIEVFNGENVKKAVEGCDK
ncbi:MAG TPA: hypothetical protein VHM26_11560 [Chitinophagaceae bacterium]|nr:hypothetical protein [Chitinophagaceae bacterium]